MTNRAAFLLTPTETPFLRDRMLYSPRLKEDCCLINTRDVLNPSKTHRPPSFKVNKEKGIKIEEGRPGKHEVVRLETYRKCIIARFYPLQNVNREKATCIKLQVPREQNETIVVDGTVLFQYFQKEGKNVVRMCRFDDETFADRPVAEYFVTDTTPALSSPEFLHFSAQPPKDGEEDTFVIVDVLQSIYVFHRAGVWRVFRKRYPRREKNIAPYKFSLVNLLSNP
uniref:Uncharacterized protein n=1 Tax=Steinernema glaseri TaxID=37863 RepID=A0A1I7YHV2_9BILA